MEKVVILSAVRTPIGRFGGAFKDISAVSLGATCSREAVARAGIQPSDIDEVIIGHARQAGNGPNSARQVLCRAGIPVDRPAFTVNKACASGMKALALGADSLLLGESRIVLAGGIENMSQVPYLLDGGRWGYRLGHGQVVDAMYRDGLYCPLAEMIMGETVETLATKYQIGRGEQDAYAYECQMKARRALESGKFLNEIVSVSLKDRHGKEVLVSQDEHPRPDTSLEQLARLAPVFAAEGTITAGNSSGLTDGAAAFVLTTGTHAQALGLRPVAEILGVASAGVEPREMGLGPVPATQRVLEKVGLSLRDVDLIEINEAFAAQVLAVERHMDWDTSRRNIRGGAIALGHPIGCTGARIVVTLLHALIDEAEETGLATLCVSGGQGMSMLIRRC